MKDDSAPKLLNKLRSKDWLLINRLLLKKVFSCEIFEIFKSTSFKEDLKATGSKGSLWLL